MQSCYSKIDGMKENPPYIELQTLQYAQLYIKSVLTRNGICPHKVHQHSADACAKNYGRSKRTLRALGIVAARARK